MKIYLVFSARLAFDQEAEKNESVKKRNAAIMEASSASFANPLLYDWDYPVLPRKGDLIRVSDIADKEDFLPVPGYFYEAIQFKNLDYHVDIITWCSDRGEIIPKIHLLGE